MAENFDHYVFFEMIEIFLLTMVNGQFSPMIQAQLQEFDEIYDFSTRDFLTTSTTTTDSPTTTTEITKVQRVRNQNKKGQRLD